MSKVKGPSNGLSCELDSESRPQIHHSTQLSAHAANSGWMQRPFRRECSYKQLCGFYDRMWPSYRSLHMSASSERRAELYKEEIECVHLEVV
ncbi:hypothetical protein NQZ68_026638 [Dissostichus eleginoides]|nr:hypothetical protein NQZ68_026638 [Dissostichus eleginoides]